VRALAILLLAACAAFAAPKKETLTLKGGLKATRYTKEGHEGAILTPNFAIYYDRYPAFLSGNRTKADKHAERTAWALERAWSTILGKMHFRLGKKSWMNAARVPVTIMDPKKITKSGRAIGMARRHVSFFGSVSGDILVAHSESKSLKREYVLYATCAHEFFHLIQYEYAMGEDHWIYDGTAVWMEDKVFPARAKSHPGDYGARYYLRAWNEGYNLSLKDESDNHGYADSFLIQYLTEQTGDALVFLLWEKMRAKSGENTGAAFEQTLGGKDQAWGPEFRRRYADFVVANLIRDKAWAPSPRYVFQRLKTPLPDSSSYSTIPTRTFNGLFLFGRSGKRLVTQDRSVRGQAMGYDEIRFGNKPPPGPADVTLLVRGRGDADWSFAAVRRPASGKWPVESFEPPEVGAWAAQAIRVQDPFRDALYLAWARHSREKGKGDFTAVVLSPPVVTRFEIREADPDDKIRRKGETEFHAVVKPVWVCVRLPYAMLHGQAYRTRIEVSDGIVWRETQSNLGGKLDLAVETSTPITGTVTVRFTGAGKTLDAHLAAVAGKPNRYEAEVALKDLEPLSKAEALSVEIWARDALGRGIDGDPGTAPEVVVAEKGDPSLDWIEGWEGGPLEHAILGGTDDLGKRRIPILARKARPVALQEVRAARKKRIFYDTRSGALLPADAGRIEFELLFGRDMDKRKPAQVALGKRAVAGSWTSSRAWKGSLDWPADGPRGWQTLSVAGVAVDGVALDTDPKQKGAQPDTHHRLLFDCLPIHAASIDVTGGGTTYYSAHWEGGAVLSQEQSISSKDLKGRRARHLVIRKASDLPASGVNTLFVTLRLSQPVKEPPSIKLGGVAVKKLESKQGAFWMGTIALADVRKAVPQGGVQIEIDAHDAAGRNLDADPRTIPAASAKGATWWDGYESTAGGADDGKGGTDRWHRIEAPPRVSYVLILDASKSMENQNRMVNSKKAIRALLDQLPQDVEMGLVVFYGPNHTEGHGFTRDREAIWKWVEKAQPYDGTPLAAGIDRARRLLINRSHPASLIWRYRVFSDGQETCGGNVVEALRRLDAAIAARRGQKPAPQPPLVPPPKKPQPNPFPCRPDSWEGYRVEVEKHRPFDWVFLVETKFEERALPDGRCIVRLEERPFGVAYGASRLPGQKRRVLWRVHQEPDEVKVDEVTSDKGKAEVERVRARAAELRKRNTSMADCQKRIDTVVKENVK